MGTLAVLACGSSAALSGQTSPEPTLDYGIHGVGFTVMEVLDSTRAFRPLRDFRGELAAETARPVQVSIWYPADVSAQAPRMRAGEFRLLTESEVDFDAARDPLDAGRIRSDFIAQAVGFGQDPAAAARVWDTMTPAVRDASPIPGRYPTVLCLTSAGVSNPLLPAYLASHGFVVVSFPASGRMTEGTLEFTPNALTLDTDIDDAGFVHSLLRRLPYADTRRLAVASFSAGSLAALLWAMRDMQVSAIVAVEGWERYRRGADIISTSVHYEPHRVRVPFLMIERAADETSPLYAKVPDVVGALPYADITRVAFRDAAHVDFLSHTTFGHTPHHGEIYEATLGIIRRFLQSSIGEDDAAARVAVPDDTDPIFTVERQLPVGPVPTEEELYRLAETDPTAAEAAYRDARRIMPGATLFRRHVLVRAARFAVTAEDSATIMRIVDDAYPDSSTAARSSPGGANAEPEVAAPVHDRLPLEKEAPIPHSDDRREFMHRGRVMHGDSTRFAAPAPRWWSLRASPLSRAPPGSRSTGSGLRISATWRLAARWSRAPQMRSVSSPTGVRYMNSCDVLPPIIPSDRLGAPVDFLYDAVTGRPAGIRLLNHTGRGEREIVSWFADWRRVGAIELPFEITITQGDDVYRFQSFHASTHWLADAAFRAPATTESER